MSRCTHKWIDTYIRGELGAVEVTLLGFDGVSVRSLIARRAEAIADGGM